MLQMGSEQEAGHLGANGSSSDAEQLECPIICIDAAGVATRFAHDTVLIREVIEAFRDEQQVLESRLQGAIDARDKIALARAAHAIKSSAGNVGAQRLWWHADCLERSAAHLEDHEFELRCNALRQEWVEAVYKLRAIEWPEEHSLCDSGQSDAG
jgi:HPt (histidine-containing phosphotransfer) domain-containing protein